MTMHGVILGTAAYMSPEQAAGKPVDRRTDLWAFGVVLFEMLTGRQMFDGESVSHVIAAVLKDEPDWKALPRSHSTVDSPIVATMPRARSQEAMARCGDGAHGVRRCADVALRPAVTGSAAVVRSPWHLAGALVAGAIIAGVAAWAWWPSPVPAPESSRFAIDLPAERQFTRAGRHVLALSPDGTQLVYVANRRLFVHSFRTLESRELEGTGNIDPSEPVFSPDGAWIAFWSDGEVKKDPCRRRESGHARRGRQSAWSVVVRQSDCVGAAAIDSSNTRRRRRVQDHRDDRAGLRRLGTDAATDRRRARSAVHIADREDDWDSAEIVTQELSTGQRTTLVKGGTDGRALPGGVLMYARDNGLFAVGFDERRRETTGETVALERDVMPSVGGFTGASQAAWSASGSLAYVADSTVRRKRPAVDDAGWKDRGDRVSHIPAISRAYGWPLARRDPRGGTPPRPVADADRRLDWRHRAWHVLAIDVNGIGYRPGVDTRRQ